MDKWFFIEVQTYQSVNNRPFKYEKREYKDRWQETVPEISAKPDSTYNDNYIFVLRTSSIRKMNLETSLNI